MKKHLAFKLIKSKEEYTDFDYSEKIQNWAITKGSTGKDTTLRVLIPATTLNKYIFTETPLGLIISSMQHLSAYSLKSDCCTVIYLEEINNSEKQILEQYPEILIEYKTGYEQVF